MFFLQIGNPKSRDATFELLDLLTDGYESLRIIAAKKLVLPSSGSGCRSHLLKWIVTRRIRGIEVGRGYLTSVKPKEVSHISNG